MFTGIITHCGKLVDKRDSTFSFSAPHVFLKQMTNGTSVAVNGVCLSVIAKSNNTFSVDVIPETLYRTMLALLQKGSLVNLELPTTPQTLLSGHIVYGHVDGVGSIKRIQKNGNSHVVTVVTSERLTKYMVAKDAVSVNGISLTIIAVTKRQFSVGIIPFTQQHTTLKEAKAGDTVNIEVDSIGKYVYTFLKKENYAVTN